jgi:hypothetical protein
MRKGLLVVLIWSLGFLIMTFSISSAEIIQKYGASNISILDFVLVSSNQTGDILTRTFKLKVENNTNKPLYDVKFTLIHASDQVTIEEGEVYLDVINPSETVIIDDDFTYSVDVSKTNIIPEIELHWGMEYEDMKGEHQGEALIKENFRKR